MYVTGTSIWRSDEHVTQPSVTVYWYCPRRWSMSAKRHQVTMARCSNVTPAAAPAATFTSNTTSTTPSSATPTPESTTDTYDIAPTLIHSLSECSGLAKLLLRAVVAQYL